jgi:2-polyprenyl-3-methyl-5-hydroxy-6-metoxy-1,4-benzoquinol methylase
MDALARESRWSSAWDWHILSQKTESSAAHPSCIRVSDSLPELRSVIPDYDLVLCSYGLTAFEALASEVPVLLLNPSAYHDRLGRSAGLTAVPRAWKKDGRSLIRGLKPFLGEPRRLMEISRRQFRRYPPGRGSFPEWLKGMTISRDACPACGSSERRAVRRFENKSYFRCSDCSLIYMVQFRKKDEIYTEDYFFAEYKSQYGKTYIEDFEGIAAMGRRRLAVMARLGKRSGRLLDIGCAYGPFLREARDAGFQAWGLEIAPEAVDYVNTELSGISARVGNIEEPSSEALFSEPFDVVSFWYVIEHMQRLDEVLPRVARMLNPGGMLCLATPCGRGISGLKDQEEFLRRSPEDHYSVWTRASARRILRRHGFGRIRFRSTGHHPERFPRLLCLLLPFSLRAGISRLFGLGDSIEIYATRDKT